MYAIVNKNPAEAGAAGSCWLLLQGLESQLSALQLSRLYVTANVGEVDEVQPWQTRLDNISVECQGINVPPGIYCHPPARGNRSPNCVPTKEACTEQALAVRCLRIKSING